MQRSQRSKWLLVPLLSSLALGTAACSLQIDQTFAMQDGSGVDMSIINPETMYELPQGRLEFEGGVVMRITLNASLLDYLDGTVDGDLELLDLLFAVPSFRFLITNTGLSCVVLQDPPGGGTFSYDVLAQEATFDALINTIALSTSPSFANLIRGGGFVFPFQLAATIPLSLIDALGFFTGTGTLEVSQDLDEIFTVPIVFIPSDPSQDTLIPIRVKGTVTLQSTDTFPVTPLVLQCLDFLATQSG